MSTSDLADVERLAPQLRDVLAGRRVAVVQEWISARAGSEKVFEAIAALVPQAELFALSVEPGVNIETGGRPITTSLLDRDRWRQRRDLTLPLMPLAWRQLRGSRQFDVVITSSHCFSRAFARRSDVHLSMVHSPVRYLWYPELDQRTKSRVYQMALPARLALKRVDLATARRTTSFASNSATVQRRVGDLYHREATVIYPPVATRYFEAAAPRPRTHLLAFSRFVPYKRLDDAIRVSAALSQPLVVAGDGPMEAELRALAATLGAPVEFRIRPTDAEVRDLFAGATALLFLANEDFGIVPVEAQAAGCPIVTSGEGGALETVVDGRTGAHAATPALDDVIAATRRLLEMTLSEDDCRAQARRFSYGAFGERCAAWIRDSAQL